MALFIFEAFPNFIELLFHISIVPRLAPALFNVFPYIPIDLSPDTLISPLLITLFNGRAFFNTEYMPTELESLVLIVFNALFVASLSSAMIPTLFFSVNSISPRH